MCRREASILKSSNDKLPLEYDGVSMNGIELVGGAGVLFATVGVAVVAHELTHSLVLWALGIPHHIDWLPVRNASGRFEVGVRGPLATVTPRSIPRDRSSWGLRLAAVAPLVLATPILLVLLGVLPDPFASGNPFVIAATIGWFGCALPSPQDFSVFWYADRVLDERAGPIEIP